MIKVGVIVANEFTRSNSKSNTKGGFGWYGVDYSDRNEAVERPWEREYDPYLKYMENSMKSTGLFTMEKDVLTDEEKKTLRHIFNVAQENGSPLYRPIISFDNEWLELNGLYSSKDGWVDEKTLRNIIRESIEKGIRKEGLVNAVWSAAFHYNTDNIHCHVSCVEPLPTREIIKRGEYAGERRGKFKESSISLIKSSIANRIIEQQLNNTKMNDIIRNRIIGEYKKNPLYKDFDILEQFSKVHKMLPEDKRKWNYGMNALIGIRPHIDNLARMYIQKYHKDDFEELQRLLKLADENYKMAYGNSNTRGLYSDGKLEDLYKRLGNQILKSMKDYDTLLKKDQISQQPELMKMNEEPQTQSQQNDYYNNRYKDGFGHWRTRKKDSLKIRSNIQLHSKSSVDELGKVADSLIMAMKIEYINARNQYEHELLERQSELSFNELEEQEKDL